MTTKERIIDEALTLFSTKGFKGTSVKNIADTVGIRDASLYKHFGSKQEILDAIVDTMKQHITDISNTFGISEENNLENIVDLYAELDVEALVEFSNRIFLFYLKDSFLSRFWRMGTIEQYGNSEVEAVFNKLFMEDSITYQAELFACMIEADVFINADPHVMAVFFYSPIFFLLSKYSNTTGKEEEALQILDKQVREFYRIYHK